MSRYTSYFECVPDDLKPQTSIPVGVLQWRTLDEFPNYEISTFGLIRRHNPGLNKKFHLVGKILKPYLIEGVYPEVELSNSTGQHRRKVHILLAQTFLDKRPERGELVRHLDHRPQVPTAWSVGWGTLEDNVSDRDYHRLIHALQDPSDELLNCAALLIEMQLNGLNGKEASKKWDVHYSKISKLKNAQRHALELDFLHKVLLRLRSKN